MFDPRKLIPLSIEFCRAPIAVITEIIEKTPMVMPIIVKAERSLFAPNEARAILSISAKTISIKAEMTNDEWQMANGWRDAVGYSSFEHWGVFRHSSFGFRHFGHSYLSAVTGSRRDAVHAGARPENNPVKTDTTILAITKASEK
jgi:hypothetical protein